MIILESNVGYRKLTPGQKAKIVNGAGAKGAWYNFLIPNTMYGLDCTEAFNIHDYDYHVGLIRKDKDDADARMLRNLFRIINHKGGWLAWLRRRRALKYYEAVHMYGDKAFFAGKPFNEKTKH